jgi:hypothetical protein
VNNYELKIRKNCTNPTFLGFGICGNPGFFSCFKCRPFFQNDIYSICGQHKIKVLFHLQYEIIFSSPVQHKIIFLLFLSQFCAAFETGKKSGTATK